jgi:hypothetical protein
MGTVRLPEQVLCHLWSLGCSGSPAFADAEIRLQSPVLDALAARRHEPPKEANVAVIGYVL